MKAAIVSLASGGIMLLSVLAPLTSLVQGATSVGSNTTVDAATTSVSASNQTSANVLGNTVSTGLTAQIGL